MAVATTSTGDVEALTRHSSIEPPVGLTLGERKIVVATILLITMIVASTLVVMAALRKEAIESRFKLMTNLAVPLAGETNRALQAMELVLRNVAEGIENARIDNEAQLTEVMSSLSSHDRLLDRISAFAYIDALVLASETGKIVNTTRYWPAPNLNVSDRNYFKAVQNLLLPKNHLGRPFVGRIAHRPILVLARRFTAPNGAFLGAVNAAIDQAYFERTLASIDISPGGLISFVRADGSELARSPGGLRFRDDEHNGASAKLAKALSVLASEGGVLPVGALDEEERLAAVHRLADFPAAIVVSMTKKSVEDEIARSMFPIAIAAFLICVVIVLTALALGRDARSARRIAAVQYRQARTDTLTKLGNRLWLSERLEHLVSASNPTPFVLLIINLDFFKVVNDSLGHDVGDELIKVVTTRLTRSLGEQDEIAHVGGDEFAVLRRGPSDESDWLRFAHLIIAAIEAPVRIGLHRIATGCSIGIAFFPGHGESAVSLLKKADLALGRAKADGRGVARAFCQQLTLAVQTRHALQLDLDDAWRGGQFYVEYQPIFEIGTRRLAGFEALLRWNHPQRGQVRPDVFIPIAEETGLILTLGAWVLEEACREAMRWQRHLFISINLSPVQFRGGALEQQVLNALARSGLPAHRLELEVTESTLLHEGAAVQTAFDQFRQLGIAVALDDFGTGYSSLAYLKHLRIDRIKIDRSFVSDSVSNPSGRAILNAIFGLATALGVKTTAEGIETEEQIAVMKHEGCTHLQGFLLGRPMSQERALRFVQESE